jgi:hypothetical protein
MKRRTVAADKLRAARAKTGKQKLAFLGFGKKKAEAAKPPDKKEKPKGAIGRARDRAKQARREKLIAAGFTPEEAAEMEP